MASSRRFSSGRTVRCRPIAPRRCTASPSTPITRVPPHSAPRPAGCTTAAAPRCTCALALARALALGLALALALVRLLHTAASPPRPLTPHRAPPPPRGEGAPVAAGVRGRDLCTLRGRSGAPTSSRGGGARTARPRRTSATSAAPSSSGRTSPRRAPSPSCACWSAPRTRSPSARSRPS